MSRLILRVHSNGQVFVVHDPYWKVVQEEIKPGLYRPLPADVTVAALRLRATRIEVATAGEQPRVLASYPSYHGWEANGAGRIQVSLDVPRWMVTRLDELAAADKLSRGTMLKDLLIAQLLAPVPTESGSPVAHRCQLDDGRVVLLQLPYTPGDWSNWRVIMLEVRPGIYQDVSEHKELLAHIDGFREVVLGNAPQTVLARFATAAAWQEKGAGALLITPELPRWLVVKLDEERNREPRQHVILDSWLRFLYAHPLPPVDSPPS